MMCERELIAPEEDEREQEYLLQMQEQMEMEYYEAMELENEDWNE